MRLEMTMSDSGPRAAQPFATGMSQAIQIHPWLPSVGAGRVNGRPLRRLRPRPPRAVAGAARPARPCQAGVARPCRGRLADVARWPDGCAAAAAPGRRGTPRNRAGSRAGPAARNSMYFIPHAGQVNRASSSVSAADVLADQRLQDGRQVQLLLLDQLLSLGAAPGTGAVPSSARSTMSVRCTVAGLEQNWHFTPGSPP